MTTEIRNSSLLRNGSVNTFPGKRTRNNRRTVFSVVRAALVATQRCGKHISAAVNQLATIEEEMFSMEAAPRLYNEDLRQLELDRSSAQRIKHYPVWRRDRIPPP
jgi:hypothetical protein